MHVGGVIPSLSVNSCMSYAPLRTLKIARASVRFFLCVMPLFELMMLEIYRFLEILQGRRRRVTGGGTCPPPPLSKVGGTSGFVPPPPLLGRANVLISLFAHILWLKTQFFQNFLGSLRSPTLIDQYFLNFANLKH